MLVADVLLALAATEQTGCIRLEGTTSSGRLWLRAGQLTATRVDGEPARLSARLTTWGAVDAEIVAAAEEVRHRELPRWRLGELLVHLGYVDASLVAAAVAETLRDDAARLLGGPVTAIGFSPGRTARPDLVQPVPVPDLIADVDRRRARWTRLPAPLRSDQARPRAVAAVNGSAAARPAEQRRLLGLADGSRTLRELGNETGLSLIELAELLAGLVASESVTVDAAPASAPYGPPPEGPPPHLTPNLRTALGLIEPEPEPEPKPKPDPDPEPEPDPDPEPEPEPVRPEDRLADTAALLRELSALGRSDAPSPVGTAPGSGYERPAKKWKPFSR